MRPAGRDVRIGRRRRRGKGRPGPAVHGDLVHRDFTADRLDDAVATQDTVTQLVAQIRRVRSQVTQAAAVEVTAHDYTQAGKPVIDSPDPDAREALVSGW